MKEPRPAKIAPPKDSEPRLRVGIVLAEDEKSTLSVTVPAGYRLRDDADFHLECSAEQSFQLSATKGRLSFSCARTNTCSAVGLPFFIEPAAASLLTPQEGVLIEGVVAGRGFHWRKELSQTFPGGLEIFLDNDRLIVVNVLGFEDYLASVISSEMSPRCPPELSKALAVAARSWAMTFLGHKHTGLPYTICNDDDCQRYQGSTHLNAEAIQSTRDCRGEFLVSPKGFVVPGYYSKSCGGHSEKALYAFGFDVAGLQDGFDGPGDLDSKMLLDDKQGFAKWVGPQAGAASRAYCSPSVVAEADLGHYLGAVDQNKHYFRWEYELSAAQLVENLRTKFVLSDVRDVHDILPGKRGASGRFLTLKLVYSTLTGEMKQFLLEDQYEIRRALHQSFLFSSAFVYQLTRAPSGALASLKFKGAGWGHGVGLCQIGAVGMALQGKSYQEILAHYYPGAKILKTY